jgi:hypothetical protein
MSDDALYVMRQGKLLRKYQKEELPELSRISRSQILRKWA